MSHLALRLISGSKDCAVTPDKSQEATPHHQTTPNILSFLLTVIHPLTHFSLLPCCFLVSASRVLILISPLSPSGSLSSCTRTTCLQSTRGLWHHLSGLYRDIAKAGSAASAALRTKLFLTWFLLLLTAQSWSLSHSAFQPENSQVPECQQHSLPSRRFRAFLSLG